MKLTVVIPVYNQPELCRQCLRSLKSQTFRDFGIVLVDDGGSRDYKGLIKEFPEQQINYERNEKNLGAILNIFYTIFYPVQTEYVMSMHEDDLLHPSFLERAVNVLDTHPQSEFAGSKGIFFDEEAEALKLAAKNELPVKVSEFGAADFVRFILGGSPFMLGSAVYRSQALLTAPKPNLAGLSVSCDRPFLVDLIGDNTCLVFNEPMFYSRRHGKKDMRGKDMDWQQVFGLYEYYRSRLPQPLSLKDQRLFLTSSTNNLLLSYRSLFPDKRPSRFLYIGEGKRRGLIKFDKLNSKGSFGLLSMCLGSTFSFYLLKAVQGLRQKIKPSPYQT